MNILNKLPFSFVLFPWGIFQKTEITESKGKKHFRALISSYQIAFRNIEPIYNGSSMHIPLFAESCQLCSIHILKSN